MTKTGLIVLAATLAIAVPAAATDLADATVHVTLAHVDPAVDGSHDLRVRVTLDEAGTPQVTFLLDGRAPEETLPAAPGLPAAPPALPGAPALPEAPALP